MPRTGAHGRQKKSVYSVAASSEAEEDEVSIASLSTPAFEIELPRLTRTQRSEYQIEEVNDGDEGRSRQGVVEDIEDSEDEYYVQGDIEDEMPVVENEKLDVESEEDDYADAAAHGAQSSNDGTSSGSDDREASPVRATRKKTKKQKLLPHEMVGKNTRSIEKSMERYKVKLPSICREIAKRLAAKKPIESLSDVEALAPKLALGDSWSGEERRRAEADWRKLHKGMQMPKSSKNKDLVTLYKACMIVMDCLPQDIISPKFFLEYDTTQNALSRTGHEWTPGFCIILKDLVTHPLWYCDLVLLAHAISYTVLAEAGDKRGWTWQLGDFGLEQPFMDRFYAACKPGVDVASAHKEASGTGQIPRGSQWKYLFQEIDKEIAKREGPHPPADPDCSHFPVNVTHLEILRDGLENMSYSLGYPRFSAIDYYSRLVVERRSRKAYPCNKDTMALREYALCRAYEILCHHRKTHRIPDPVAVPRSRADTPPPRRSARTRPALKPSTPAQPDASKTAETPAVQKKKKEKKKRGHVKVIPSTPDNAGRAKKPRVSDPDEARVPETQAQGVGLASPCLPGGNPAALLEMVNKMYGEDITIVERFYRAE